MDDTIAAITTAPGEAGIAIVRLSGPQALAIGDAVYTGRTALSAMRANTFAYGRVVADRDAGNVLDEVIVLVYRAPRSYTCEDVVEIQSHGGSIAARRILRAVISHGARLAEPGEFTRRAFLNGRLDLLQAEAVADLIRARSDRAADAAVEQLSGRLSNAFNEIYDGLIILAADIEATLDFVEEELPEATMPDLAARLSTVRGALDALLATWEEGHLLRDGALVVISGQPNVGKSTLMNALLGKDRAIVTDVAGTTRDTIEEQMILDGVPLRLVDTAGIREVDCVVEREGIRRARASINSADINIHVVDGSAPVAGQDLDMIGQLDPARTIVILNKTDLGSQAKLEMIDPAILTCACSLLTRDGAGDVVKALRTKLHAGQGAPPHAVISERHRMLADDALASVCTAAEWLARASGDAPVFAGQALREALEALGTVTGRAYSDELLDTIFSRFCVGK